MIPAVEPSELLPGVFEWRQFSEAHKVELTSHAVLHEGILWVFDPIPLADDSRRRLFRCGDAVRVVLTNENHVRDSEAWTFPGPKDQVNKFGPWISIPIPGAAPGETGFFLKEQSLLVLGDAVVNLPPRGLEILPAKYCQDAARLPQDLHAICALRFENLLLAHGESVLGEAWKKVEALI